MTPLYARHKRTTLAVATAVAAGALLSTGLAAGTASAQTPADSTGNAQLAAAPTSLTAAARTSLLQKAQADVSETAQQIGLGTKEKLVAKDVVKDVDGTVHTRYERTYAGLPVLGGDLVVHTAKSGRTEGVTRATKTALKVASLKPQITAAKAEKQAVSAAKTLGSAKTAADGARKVIWAGSGKPVLAFETIVGGLQDDGTPNQLHVITDAATGKKLFEYQGIENATGTGKTLYSGTVSLTTTLSGTTYSLTDASRGSHKTYNLKHGTSGTGTLFTNTTNTWGTGAASSSTTDVTAAADAAYGAQETWDFYKSTFGRSGIKNNGVGAYSRVHYGSSYVNAFWDDSCFCMTYGDGSGNTHPLTSLDVAGHEMSHGVTSNTAGLNYSGESGGLNEATSDIFGTGVEFYAANSNDVGDYLIGEEININGDGTPLRYMDKPSKDGGSADSWSSTVGNKDVHYSSGVANHFFYLLSEGSGAKTINGVSYNSPTSNGSTVTGIGRAKALQIWYKALTTYFTSTTNYKSARTGTLSAATALYGSGSAEYNAVAAAWSAVNVS
ncbi:M4 family metallopeptidase [Streptomyces pseudovenezuelae]|uniref:Neutral metalloproteinase n=1 Tax=Streptomyces pseudovenezuelae TaxID=67350 RepID=A0ABT6LUY0_9ACTN|nr:M4 family metallopeptidase [Streptomyces pseudovenezuelae]MDH6219506.1 Zn-dependent metalloprotease [Streptomyces pseudovenezuelae]